MYELIRTLPRWLQILTVLVPLASFGIAAGAFVLGVRQTYLANKLARLKLVSDALQVFVEDEMMRSAFYKIEYGTFEYDPECFHGAEIEKQLDKLLRHFSNAALLWRHGHLSVSDFYPIRYFVLRTLDNPGVCEYLDTIDRNVEWSTTGHPYVELRAFGEALSRYERGPRRTVR